MGADQHIDWHTAAASAIDWWREAGVDVLVEDAPRDWLAAPEAAPAPLPGSVASPAPAASAAMPADRDAFLAWRASEAAPEARWGGPRLAAEGPVDAALMLLVDLPEREDCTAGRLVTGRAGVLLDRMLAAIGFERGPVHLAAMCTARPPGGRITADITKELAAIAQRHVSLVRPPRLLVMSDAASRALTGSDVLTARGKLHSVNHDNGQSTRVVATFHPRLLLDRPACKADAWRDLQLLMRND